MTPTLKVRLLRLLCGLTGHTVTLQQDAARLWLRCDSCGLESAGWDVPRLTMPPRWKRYLRFQRRLSGAGR